MTRNKELYKDFKDQDTFSDRMIFFLLHFAFFLKIYKNDKNKQILQEIYDYVFRQMELSVREIGYGDQSINKKMKDYLNLFHGMIDKIHNWEHLSNESKKEQLICKNNFLLYVRLDKFTLLKLCTFENLDHLCLWKPKA